MINVLFVCLGNICRSPSAEAVFRSLVTNVEMGDQIEIDSAGTGAWHVGNSPDARAISLGRLLGYDLGDLKARQVGVHDFSKFDYILAMDLSNLKNLRAMAPADYEGHLSLFLDFSDQASGEVPDPYYGELADYEHVFNLLEPAATGLLSSLKTKHNL